MLTFNSFLILTENPSHLKKDPIFADSKNDLNYD